MNTEFGIIRYWVFDIQGFLSARAYLCLLLKSNHESITFV